jgi:large subunit ribosomal protein L30
MKADLNNRLIAVIRVRGTIGVRRTIKETLSRLNVKRVNNLALVFGTKANMGMIDKCQDFVTYGPIKEEALATLLEKKDKKVSKEDLSAIFSGKKRVREVVKIPITLHPPRHGYEGIKRNYSNGGALGYRGEEINELIKRMSPS